jgi:dCMP deaminase
MPEEGNRQSSHPSIPAGPPPVPGFFNFKPVTERSKMNDQLELDLKMMKQAQMRAKLSTDRSRQVGCVITDGGERILSEGWNTVPMGCAHTEDRHLRPAKYDWTEHAERNAFYAAARTGTALLGATLYVPWYPCIECGRGIVATGISRVVAYTPDFNDPRWGSDFIFVRELFDEADVSVTFLPGTSPNPKV